MKNIKEKLLLTLVAMSVFSSKVLAEEYMVGIEEEVVESVNPMTSASHKGKAQVRATAPTHPWYDAYTNWKNNLQNETGFSYTLDLSVLAQRGAPNGKGTALQFQAYPSISWQLFNNEYGSGTINASYTPTRYWNSTDGQDITDRIGVLSSINDYTTKSNSFDELSYTQQFWGSMDWLAITIGQFPMYNFDGTSYNSNQQINFVNYALSQNASSTYPVASLGMYATFTINPEWQINIGMQDANNVSGTSISSSDFGKGEYTSFASVSYTPMIKNMGMGQYSVLFYNQPGVDEQPGTSNGWSINMEQAINDKIAVFGRINGASNSPSEIKQSYVLGGVINNPLGRNELDQIGTAIAVNKANIDVIGEENTRNYETVIETYWAWGIENWMTITPDLQFYFNPAVDASN
ncbi:MAG: carbohydrate porin, partial [bacterium]|nr:carbohydrate porin [bacterium]